MMRMFCIAVCLIACGDNLHPLVPRPRGCEAQAEAWCAKAGYPTNGCHAVYEHNCAASGGANEFIKQADQNACLKAIDANTTPEVEPAACRATWEVQPVIKSNNPCR